MPSLFDRFLQPFSWHGFDQEFKAAQEQFKKRMGIGMAPEEPFQVVASEAEGNTPSTEVSADQSDGQVLEHNGPLAPGSPRHTQGHLAMKLSLGRWDTTCGGATRMIRRRKWRDDQKKEAAPKQ